ncbi:MAG: serpin family protein, partial [Actinomycetes bacterium]|nr:serpin family protein [Actinomycetes bacterium]
MAAVGVLAACAAQPDAGEYRAEVDYRQVSLSEASALAQLLAANDELGLAMLRSGEGSNVVVSPFSAYVALAMLAEGAHGETAEAFDSALGAAGGDRTDAVNALRGALLVHDGDPAEAAGDDLPEEPLLHLADRVLLDDELVPEAAFLEVLARSYDAGIETVDLGTDAAKPVLDEWVNRETGGLIPESAIAPKPSLRLVLQDALVLAARWLVPFDPNSTFEEPFETPEGTVDVEMMHGTADAVWPVTETASWTAVRLPYVDGFVADLVLPPDGIDPADADAATLAALWDGAAPAGSVAVAVPVLDLDA